MGLPEARHKVGPAAGGDRSGNPWGQHAVIVTTRLLCKPSKLNAHKTPDRAKARTAWERDWKLR
jgi:hypothetical protein